MPMQPELPRPNRSFQMPYDYAPRLAARALARRRWSLAGTLLLLLLPALSLNASFNAAAVTAADQLLLVQR